MDDLYKSNKEKDQAIKLLQISNQEKDETISLLQRQLHAALNTSPT